MAGSKEHATITIAAMAPTLLRFPNKSHRKFIDIPTESTALAELIGIVFGDGGINNNWQVVISLNALLDFKFAQYVSTLFHTLFTINVKQRIRPHQQTLVLVCSSTSLVDFLVGKGAVRGNKVLQKIDIPTWIRNNTEYQKVFVRGLIDTDGCVFTHKHIINNSLYTHVGICFTNFSERLLVSVASILHTFGLNPRVTKCKKRIYLYGQKQLENYLEIFGSSNPRIYQKFYSWRDARVA